MPAITRLSDKDSFFNLLESIELAVATSLAGAPCSINVTDWRRIVGWADPPEDCCPEIAVWADNLRVDPNSQIPGAEGRGVCGTWFLLDVHIRISECFLDTDAEGNPLPQDDINASSKLLYSDLMWCGWWAFWCKWASGGIDEIDACTPVSLGPESNYAAGGCAGIEYTVTVSVQR